MILKNCWMIFWWTIDNTSKVKLIYERWGKEREICVCRARGTVRILSRYRQFNFTQVNKIPSIQFYWSSQDTVNSISHNPTRYHQFNFTQANRIPSILLKPTEYRQINFTQAHKIPSIQFYSSPTRYRQFNFTQTNKILSIQF
jgi:hypothetical protein